MMKIGLSRFLVATVFCVAACVLLPGCAGLFQQPAPPRAEYSFSLNPPRKSPGAMAPTLAVRLFDAAPMFENQQFVYRLGPTRWETDFHQVFAQPPSALLTFETRRWMERSGLFRSVAIPGLAPAGSWQLQGVLTELYGDFQNSAAPEAVMSVRFTLLPPGAQASAQPLFTKSYEHRERLDEMSAPGLVAAWNRAGESILALLASDIREAQRAYHQEPLPPPPAPPGVLEILRL